MNFWALFGYSFLSLAVLIILVCINVFVYYTLMRFPLFKSKYLNIEFIVVSFLIVFVIHLICIFNVKHKPGTVMNFWDLLNYGIKEIYAELGGLGFEGQNIDGRIAPFFESLYFGSIAWLALSNVILISIGISYPLHSKASLFFTNIAIRFSLINMRNSKRDRKSKRCFYIFTYATKESLILANNIKENNKHAHIIFASNELEPFDKNNPIHSQISQMNYLYIPILKTHIKNRKSILRSLFKVGFLRWFFPIKRMQLLIKKYDISIFALKTYKNNEGFESMNNDIIFDDVKLFLELLIHKKPNKQKTKYTYNEFCEEIKPKNENDNFPLLNYFVLSNNTLNFEYFNLKLFEIFKDAFGIFSDDEKETINTSKTEENKKAERYAFKNDYDSSNVPLYNLTILNEATMSGENLIDIRHKKLEKENSNSDEFINYQKGGYNALVIGYGQNGQKALEHLYLDSNGGKMLDSLLEPTKFTAHVIDIDINNIIGSYIATHPSIIFTDENNTACSTEENLKNIYKNNSYDNFDYIDKYMGFLRVFYKEQNYDSTEFLDNIKKICNREYDYVIIALGDDETNIKCANMMLQNIRQSFLQHINSTKRLDIYVNIIDHNNNERLHWNAEIDSIVIKNVSVICFGNLTEIYSLRMIDFDDAIKINRIYAKTCAAKVIDEGTTNWKYEYIRNVSIYERKNNESASNYSLVYKKYLKDNNALEIIKNDYNRYLDFLSKKKNDCVYTNNYGQHCLAFDNIIEDETLKNNLLEIFKNSGSNMKINASIANYERIINFNNAKLNKSDADYYWRYLIQLEHSRWARHMMIYGRTFTKDYKIIQEVVLKNNQIKDLSKKYWKNNLKLHACLLPYSELQNFHSKQFNKDGKYLKYTEEDYDYGSIVVALNLDENNEIIK